MQAALCHRSRRPMGAYLILGIPCVFLAGMVAGADKQWAAIRLHGARSLPNAYRVHSRVVSGGVPDGDAGFQQLRELGIQTIISVDGAKPDLQRARRFGLRYVHLPHGYDGIPESHRKALAKAVLELPGPVYIHCHHGKHRSPAAAIVASVGAGLVERGNGVAFLHAAGTSERYVGLFGAAQSAKRFSRSELRSYQVAFPAVAQVTPLANAMVDLDRAFDRLRTADEWEWSNTSSQPEATPTHQAMILKEHFAELLRLRSERRPQDFRDMLTHSRDAASEVVALLEAGPLTAKSQASLRDSLITIQTNCRRCHRRYRDR